MQLAYRFKGEDNNHFLKNVQGFHFESLIRWIYKACKSEYLQAIDYVGVETDLSKEIRNSYPANFQNLYEAYEIIAAYFRYLHEKTGQLILPTLVNGCEGLSPEEATKIYYIREWSEFWYEETRQLSKERDIALAVLETHIYQKTNKADEPQKMLSALLFNRYNAKIYESNL